jgi:hypothetical protein
LLAQLLQALGQRDVDFGGVEVELAGVELVGVTGLGAGLIEFDGIY